jgi:V/A-type H+/Na+-transporting ATPase subunit E
MGEDIQALLDKIHREGIEAAQVKASDIEHQAKEQAKIIIERAKEQAQVIVTQAQTESRKESESSSAALAQAGRDLLLTLRAQLEKMLGAVSAAGVAGALKPEQIAHLIADLVTSTASGKEQVVVTLSERELEQTRNYLLGMLAQDVKKGIVLKADTDVKVGFCISFDGGKSQFDFSDASLADYLSRFVKPELARILQEVSTGKRT